MEEILEFLGPLGFLFIASFALILYEVARVILIDPVTGSIRTIPYIGANLADWLKGFWDSLESNLQAQVDVQVHNISDLVAFVSGSIQLFFNAATNTAEWLGVQVDNAFTLARNTAGDLGAQIGNLVSLAQKAGQDILDLFSQVQHIADHIATQIHDAIGKAITDFRAEVETAIRSEVHAVVDPVRAHLLDRLAHLHLRLQTEEGRAAHAEGHLQTELDDAKTATADEIKVIKQTLNAKIGNVEGSLETELQGITDLIGTVAAGTTVIGLITTVATDLTRMQRECVDPTCGYLGPQLSILNGIADAATAVAFGAFMLTAIQNPKGAANAITGTVNGLEGIFGPLFSGMSGINL